MYDHTICNTTPVAQDSRTVRHVVWGLARPKIANWCKYIVDARRNRTFSYAKVTSRWLPPSYFPIHEDNFLAGKISLKRMFRASPFARFQSAWGGVARQRRHLMI